MTIDILFNGYPQKFDIMGRVITPLMDMNVVKDTLVLELSKGLTFVGQPPQTLH